MNTEKTGPITWRGLVGRGQAVMVIAALGLAVACPAWAGGFEYPGVRQASQILPKQLLAGPHFKVRKMVVTYGYLNHWTVDSDFGVCNGMMASGAGGL